MYACMHACKYIHTYIIYIYIYIYIYKSLGFCCCVYPNYDQAISETLYFVTATTPKIVRENKSLSCVKPSSSVSCVRRNTQVIVKQPENEPNVFYFSPLNNFLKINMLSNGPLSLPSKFLHAPHSFLSSFLIPEWCY
jgi:hypothetical protein